ncbi:type II toxin-antitoxin system YafQ family toxin [Pseudotamlana carrageenivorans]|uniref:Type II toxin-antitoxin system mRNA interferase toxin, RelE/StbE family n=1 Tax=Pseudotamlana carrageenivorans TaxID=2069432 RepID=A0A2I7SES4_9FLAO|nr:type II toxin-antitoxin system YafQ family toxin [Tamlana carrageenivorans]AUS04399.1 type II toxin-antitoxin system mRNA interferase toxin, RelE/StbE family [Tamlana carrageenivorans]
MYKLSTTNRFDKDLKRCLKRGYDLKQLKVVLLLLEKKGSLPKKYKPHKLKGNYAGCWECHIKPDWLLVWKQDDNKLTLLLTNTGTHSDLFK